MLGEIVDALNGLFRVFQGTVGFLAALAALSTLTMAVIQAAKNLLPLRHWFNRARVRRWLAQRMAPQKTTAASEVLRLERELVLYVADGDARALYGSDVDTMCKQLSAALQNLIDYPHMAKDLLPVLLAGADKGDIAHLSHVSVSKEADAADKPVDAVSFGVRSRLRAYAFRSVEALRLSTTDVWQFSLQTAAFVLSASLVIVPLCLRGLPRSPGTKVEYLAIALFAGFLAPVASDLLAGVERLRG